MLEASGRFASDANLYEGNSSGPGTPLRQAEDTISKPNAVLDQLEWLLQQAGYAEGEDYTRESLEQPMPMAARFPAFTGNQTDTEYRDPVPGDLQHTHWEFCPGIITEVYWYHPNYLGSVDLVTKLSGHAHQFFMYTAWGEAMYEYTAQSAPGSFDSPYRFNGKELDKETGYGYYGARYYQSKLSMWLSVDPLAHKYPNMSPYNFSGNNPVMLVDPDGRWIPGLDEDGNPTYIAEKGDNRATLQEQYNLSDSQVDKLLGTDFAVIAGETKISGSQAKEVTGSEILKLNVSSKTITDDDKNHQMAFAINYENALDNKMGLNNADFEGNINDYFAISSTMSDGSIEGLRTLSPTRVNLLGENINMTFDYGSKNDGKFSTTPNGMPSRNLHDGYAIDFLHPNAYNKKYGIPAWPSITVKHHFKKN